MIIEEKKMANLNHHRKGERSLVKPPGGRGGEKNHVSLHSAKGKGREECWLISKGGVFGNQWGVGRIGRVGAKKKKDGDGRMERSKREKSVDFGSS